MNYNTISSHFYHELLELKKETTESIEIEISGFAPEILKEWPDARAVQITTTSFKIFDQNGDIIPCHGAKKDERPFTHEVNKFRTLIKEAQLDIKTINFGDFGFMRK